MREQVIAISNELQQIYVKGIDTIHMANALKGLSDLMNMLPAEEDGATMEQRGEEDE